MSESAANGRARLRSYPARSSPDEIPLILARGLVAHVGFCEGNQPYVIPMSYHYDPAPPSAGSSAGGPPAAGASADASSGRLFIHGSTKGRAMRHLASGAPVCVTVTLLDGLVYSRTALDHTMNYRSAVCFGHGRTVENEAEVRAIFERMVARYFPGRRAGVDYQDPEPGHLETTALVEVVLEAWSGKVRRGGANGPLDDDEAALGSAGVVEARSPEAA